MISRLFFALIFFLLSYNCVYGAVFVNEVAWMGTLNSSTDEWIELKNDTGEPISLSGWTLVVGESAIPLSGSIGSNGFYLIERTDDATVPGINADLIPKNPSFSLTNSGGILSLKDSDGVIVDEIGMGAGWVAGDNSTKQTMQRVSVGNWATNDPTPRSENISSNSINNEEDEADSNTESFDEESNEPVIIVPPNVPDAISVKISSDKKIAIAGDIVYFQGEIRGAPSRLVWNFGDGASREFGFQKTFEKTDHIYFSPGEYLVFLDAYKGEDIVSSKLKISVIPLPFEVSSVGAGINGFIEVKNNSSYDLDISFWRLRAGSSIFTIPKNTFILAKKKLIFSSKVTGLRAEEGVTLLYPNAEIASVYGFKPQIASKVAYSGNTVISTTQFVPSAPQSNLKEEIGAPIEGDTSDFTSSVVESDFVTEGKSNSLWENIYVWLTLLLVVLGVPIVLIFLFKASDFDQNEIRIIE